ncbi:YtzI protein [Salinibacillus xinjiangensis]|uniref:YtzI protein n=1 Tax=Salinibacillus xinjiangensis TaxID=1229268 RepID=A0A6G1X8P7_9BACI|nr:YtzI protein [Salinibacillus xinjiangensis]MRG87309.1 YtzI protein [Salinibacillus xinjiangensis]
MTLGYILLGIVIVLSILVLSLIAISKGYAYKHTVDPLPPQQEEKNETKDM